jgi:ABC-type transport system substrate-binding protein
MGVELTDRVAIVTGAAQGIGEATAKKLAERGAIVVGLDKQGDRLTSVMAGIGKGVAMVVDVTDAEADRQAVKEIHQRFGRIDILVNVAGGTQGAARGVDTLTIADWHKVMDLNLHAPLYMCLAVAPIMKAQRRGRIITVDRKIYGFYLTGGLELIDGLRIGGGAVYYYGAEYLKQGIQPFPDAYGELSTKGGAFSYGSYPDIDEIYPQQADENDPKKRTALLDKMQQLVHEKAMYVPIWQLAFLNGVGPRVGESSFGQIPGFAYTAPFEDLTLKA